MLLKYMAIYRMKEYTKKKKAIPNESSSKAE